MQTVDYLLRTNLQNDTAQQLWSKYMQLTEAEASVRVLKSELSIRSLFHQLESGGGFGLKQGSTLEQVFQGNPERIP